MKIRHIASMATGHDREMLLEARAADPGNPVRSFFGIPPDAEPGTLFAYNQPPVLALAMILQRLAGERLVDYLKPRLLEPLGISGFRWAQAQPGVDMGFSGVYTNLDAVARLGQLYLDDGMWNGQRVLPEGWVADASRVHIENPQRIEPDWRQGYGFQLWMSQHGYRGDGAYGQYMVVLPAYDAMIAMFSCIEQMQVVLDLMWEHLLPGMGANRSATTEDAALADRLTGLALPTATQHRGGEPAQPANQSFQPAQHNPLSQRSITSVEIADNTMVVHEGDAAIHVPLNNEWTINSDGAVAASSTALLDGTIAVSLLFLDTPHRLEVELKASESTFSSKWGHMPLFGAGLAPKLQSLRAPST